jgi:hypothetical protein
LNTDNVKEWIAFFLHALRIRVLAALGKQLKFPSVAKGILIKLNSPYV